MRIILAVNYVCAYLFNTSYSSLKNIYFVNNLQINYNIGLIYYASYLLIFSEIISWQYLGYDFEAILFVYIYKVCVI